MNEIPRVHCTNSSMKDITMHGWCTLYHNVIWLPHWHCGNVPHAELLMKSYEWVCFGRALVKISDTLSSAKQWWRVMQPSAIEPRMKWSLFSICLCGHETLVVSNGYAWLTITVDRCGTILCEWWRSYMRFLNHMHFVVAVFAALDATSLDEREILGCFLICHEMGVLPIKKLC